MAFKLKGFSYPGKSPKKFKDPTKPGMAEITAKGFGYSTDPDINAQTTWSEGANIDGEYLLSGKERMDPTAIARLRKENPNIKFYGEEQAMIDKKQKKIDRKKKKGRYGSYQDSVTGEWIKRSKHDRRA